MSNWPAVRTPPGAPAPGLLAVVFAALGTWFVPIPFGAALMLIVKVIADSVTFDGPLAFLSVIGIICIYSPLFSWIGIIPGAILHYVMQRYERGGWLILVIASLVLGVLIVSYLTPLAAVFAVPLALVYWVLLRLLSREWWAGAPTQETPPCPTHAPPPDQPGPTDK